jgi:hypothetical protein
VLSEGFTIDCTSVPNSAPRSYFATSPNGRQTQHTRNNPAPLPKKVNQSSSQAYRRISHTGHVKIRLNSHALFARNRLRRGNFIAELRFSQIISKYLYWRRSGGRGRSERKLSWCGIVRRYFFGSVCMIQDWGGRVFGSWVIGISCVSQFRSEI